MSKMVKSRCLRIDLQCELGVSLRIVRIELLTCIVCHYQQPANCQTLIPEIQPSHYRGGKNNMQPRVLPGLDGITLLRQRVLR